MTSLSQPSTLCSFPISASLTQQDGTGPAPTARPAGREAVSVGPVHTPRAPGQAGEEGEVVVGVQGAAVWVYDIATHRATTSFTVSPSSRFASPPLSFYTSAPVTASASAGATPSAEAGPSSSASASASAPAAPRLAGRARRTAVAVHEGDDVGADERGRWLWVWDGDDVYEKRAIRLDHQVDQLALGPGSQSFLAAGRTHATLLTPSLERHTCALTGSSSGSAHIVRIAFAPRGQKEGHDGLAALLRSDGQVTTLRIGGDEARESIRLVAGGRVELQSGEEARDAVVEADGWMSVYTTTGRILPRCIRCFGSEGAALELDAERQEYQLRTGGEGPALPIAAIPTAHGPLVLAIAHSHAQAGAQSSATGPHLLIMHPLLPAVVAALALPLPVHGTPPAHVQLVPLGVTPTSGGGAYALVTLHRPVAGAVSAGAGAGKAVVSLLEARVPPHGVGIAGMLGSAERTAAFVLPKDAIGAQTTTEAERLVQEIEEVLAGRTLGEDDAARVEAIWQDAGKEVKSGLKPREVKRLVRAVLGPAVGPVLEDESGRANAAIPVRGVKGTYVRAVLQDLVGCAVVSDAMAAHGGVLACLIRLGDWELIDLALEVIPNLPSGSLLAALLAVLKPHTVGRSAAPDLETFLARYITVPIAGPTHRAHLHRALNVTAAATVLEVLVEWLEEWRTETTDGLLEWDEARGPTQRKQGGAELPPVQAIITHSTLLLDSHLPLLVGQPRYHDLVTRLASALDPLLHDQRELQLAHGVVHAFVSQAQQEQQQAKELRARGKGKARGVADQGVGLYRLEEIVL